MKTTANNQQLKWHLQNNVMPQLTAATIDRIIEDCENFNEGRMQLTDYIAQGVTLGQMFEDLQIEIEA